MLRYRRCILLGKGYGKCNDVLLYHNRSEGVFEWPVQRVRSTFVDYFKNKHAHKFVPSSPVVPFQDNSLTFTNAGMNQFKSVFTGKVDPKSPFSSLSRVVNYQKCIRAGGKHNDLADVGKDVFHHTFFEMLGSWSFGNYFKVEAISWAFDLLVNVYGLPTNRLYATYFEGNASLGIPADLESRDVWMQYLPEERVLPFGMKDNFWEMGDTGPCGPCSEIHFDRIGGRNAACLVNTDDPNVLEIWNLVFMQYSKDDGGVLKKLPRNHVDSGMGLERITSILQGVYSNYDTDIFSKLLQEICIRTGAVPYAGTVGIEDAEGGYRDMAYRVVADHARTATFAIADGTLPSSEGRGYVLRRILRRAFRYSNQNLGGSTDLLAQLIPTVASEYSHIFPEVASAIPRIRSVILEEEQGFSASLSRGIAHFEALCDRRDCIDILSGDSVFFMYDTLGFPPDLVELMAEEKGTIVCVYFCNFFIVKSL